MSSGETIEADQSLEAFERYFDAFVNANASEGPVAEQMAYHFGLSRPQEGGTAEGGTATREPRARRGKRLRPRLVLAAATALGADAQSAFPACAAIELLHNYSLIHDDIEDGDRVRHGRETLWAKFGVAHAINAGDAVGALAYVALQAMAGVLDARRAQAMTDDLAAAHVRMCAGQARDIAMEGGAPAALAEYRAMIDGKTVALFECAATLGARCAPLAAAHEAEVERCAEIGRLFGYAFQIRDDVLGIWGRTEDTGKGAGDITRRKQSYPIVWACSNDAHGAGRAIAAAYASDHAPRPEEVDALRAELEKSGAREAANAEADRYTEEARKLASRYEPLRRFIARWSESAR